MVEGEDLKEVYPVILPVHSFTNEIRVTFTVHLCRSYSYETYSGRTVETWFKKGCPGVSNRRRLWQEIKERENIRVLKVQTGKKGGNGIDTKVKLLLFIWEELLIKYKRN